MSALQKLIPTVRAAAVRAAPRRTLTMANQPKVGEHSEYVHARDMLVGLAGSGVFMAYAAFVVAGEPAHEEAHPYYYAPYNFVKRGADLGTGWWPGRQCQFFEFNCFAKTYAEADELLRKQ